MNETRQGTEKKFSEAASENKKKRGRPTVYKRDHMEGIGIDLEIFDGRTHRTHVNQYYRAAVSTLKNAIFVSTKIFTKGTANGL